MFNKKLKGQDFSELQKRQSLIQEQALILQALNLQKIVWLNQKLRELGFDMSKQYEINPKNGAIIEIKNEPKGSQKSS